MSEIYLSEIVCILSVQERDLGDEYGWKQVHGDVFRAPSSSLLLTSFIGTGYQLAAVLLIVVIFIIMGDLYVGSVFLHFICCTLLFQW